MLICIPAASSLALLMRIPEAKRSIDVAKPSPDFAKLRCAFSDDTLVFTVNAILPSPRFKQSVVQHDLTGTTIR